MSVSDTLFVIDIEDGREQRVVLTEYEGVVEVLQHVPCRLLDFVAGEYHVHAFVDGVFHFNGEDAGVAMKILCLALETIESVGILEVKGGDASHKCVRVWVVCFGIGYF